MFDENGEFFVNIGEVYLIYKMFCDSFDVEFFIQRCVSDLINEFDMFGIINVKVVSKGCYGRIKEIRFNVVLYMVKNIYCYDEQVCLFFILSFFCQRRLF